VSDWSPGDVRREANFRASLMLEAVLNEPWEPSDLVEAKGEQYVEEVRVKIGEIAARLMRYA